MQPDQSRRALFVIAAKEFGQFFRAPIAWLFLGTFLLITLFVFFWVEAFFARNISDLRPLFEWMPLLLIFLASALTMRIWSEERRSGTLEHVLTQPVPLWQFVLGKFLACWALLALALLLTLPLPVTVAAIGDVDWGPVVSGYIAALLLGGAYLAMGLFVSARSENQIVSLLMSIALAGAFYLIGSEMIAGLFSNSTAEWLRAIGTGSRFESITRGVLDVRDLYYYLSLIAVFLALNIFSLERGRWAKDGNGRYHTAWRWGTGLLVINFVAANFWLGQIGSLRLDTTRGQMYSISEATRGYIAQLQEPLLIRGYFSHKTHPLLAPLVPQMQDLLAEYEVVGGGRIKVEIIDPAEAPEMEEEANSTYNIRPTPFRISDRHQASLVNSYFDVLVQYGDEFQVLGFNDLIEVKAESEDAIDVQLRNPEYDVTRSIKKVLYAYQAGGNLFAAVKEPITLTAYISAESQLPSELVELRKSLEEEAKKIQAQSAGKFTVNWVDPDANGGLEARRISDNFGFAPMAASLTDTKRFFFYLTLGQGEKLMQVPLGDFSAGNLQQSLQAGIKRFANGFTRTVALVVPDSMDPHLAWQLGQPPSNKPRFDGLKQLLSEDMNVIDEDLKDGRVDAAADILVLAAPQVEDDKARFAVDQFLMRGGTVVMATSPYSASVSRTDLSVNGYSSGFEDWLKSLGVTIENSLVMDPQNSAFPVPTVREVAGLRFQELRLADYPYFVDVRGEGLSGDTLATADLPQVTVPWSSPITLDQAKLGEVKVTPLLHSSGQSWLGDSSQAMPSVAQLQQGYVPGADPKRHLLAVALQGRFTSHFAGKDSPLLEGGSSSDGDSGASSGTPSSVLARSAESARLVLFASNDLFRDQIVSMLGGVQGGSYLNSLQLALNTVDWSLEDQGLLSIRARGHFNRTLEPMESGAQAFWEYLNYALALSGLAVLWALCRYITRMQTRRYQHMLAA